MINVHSLCYHDINEDCSKSAHSKYGLDWDKTMKCVTDSFDHSDQSLWFSSKNKIFDDELKYWKKYGAQFFPSVVINNRTYRGNLEPESVFQALCSGFKNTPKICANHVNVTEGEPGVSATTVILIVVALILINVGLIFLYRRYTKREMG